MNETSWVVGFIVGGVVVVIVVAVALTIIKLATDIRDVARGIVDDLGRAQSGTAPLWEVRTTNQVAADINLAARRARELLER
ncbi:MAG: hypothetical protein R3343_12370 [Nitriliruptorales bacterium]|nr:hypothetical protein [Nitriliruptorales bacterium]